MMLRWSIKGMPSLKPISETGGKSATRSSKFWVRSSENLELRTSNPLSRQRRLGSKSRLNKLRPSSEVGRTTDLVGIVMIGAFNDIEGFRWLGRLKDLPA